MRRIATIMILWAGMAFMLCSGGWAAQTSGTETQSATGQTAKTEKAAKPKKWHGKLVDAACMVKELNSVSAQPAVGSGVPHFAGNSWQQGQYPGGGGMGQPGVPGGQTEPAPGEGQPTMGPGVGTPGRGSAENPQMQRAALIDAAAKKCAASESTSKFGLALSDGQIIQFGEHGNDEASQAVKEARLEPGKTVKATVKGVKHDNGAVTVASVTVKGKHKK